MQPRFARIALTACAAVLVSLPAVAAETGGCSAVAWPLDIEQTWFAAHEIARAQSGASFPGPPEKGIEVTLLPAARAQLPAKPSGEPKSKPADAYAGIVTLAAVEKPGLYQVTLSGPGWIDVVQNGAALDDVEHTGIKDCDAIRKSVRFEIGAGPAVLQFSSVPSPTILIAIRKAP